MATHERTLFHHGASFRHRTTGLVVDTGAFHDIFRLPGGEAADLAEWEDGFTGSDGRFYTREEAARAVGLEGHLEARAYFADEPEPVPEAGRLESWLVRA